MGCMGVTSNVSFKHILMWLLTPGVRQYTSSVLITDEGKKYNRLRADVRGCLTEVDTFSTYVRNCECAINSKPKYRQKVYTGKNP